MSVLSEQKEAAERELATAAQQLAPLKVRSDGLITRGRDIKVQLDDLKGGRADCKRNMAAENASFSAIQKVIQAEKDKAAGNGRFKDLIQ